MIDLIYHSENAFIYNIEDWEKLRKEFRCVGEFLGHTQNAAVLPLQLQPEEALLLIEKNVGKLVSYKEEVTTKEQHEQFKNALINVGKPYYKELRLQQLKCYIHKIVMGKRKRGDTRSEDEILQGEMDKFVIDDSKMIWPLIMHKFDKDSGQLIEKSKLFKLTSKVKYLTFKDMWEKHFFITQGLNFGGDFLAYPGDPLLYHSDYILRCLEEEEKVYPSELVVLGRVANQVKKKGVLSYLINDTVNYITIKWVGK